MQPIIVRVATPNAVLCASVNAVLAAVAEKEGADIVWVEPVWEGSDRPVSGGRSDLGEDPMSLVLARALDYGATLARVADAIFTKNTPAAFMRLEPRPSLKNSEFKILALQALEIS